ncbi:hypothetical protein ACX9R5_16915 [Rathayibacter sp. CAU 1779]
MAPVGGPISEQAKHIGEHLEVKPDPEGRFSSLVVNGTREDLPAARIVAQPDNTSFDSAAEITGAVTVHGAVVVDDFRGALAGNSGRLRVHGSVDVADDVRVLYGPQHEGEIEGSNNGVTVGEIYSELIRLRTEHYKLLMYLDHMHVINRFAMDDWEKQQNP